MEIYIWRGNNMSNSNDQRILELKKQIDIKKEKLGKTLRFTPVTNCSIELDGVRHNINVLSKEQLISILVKLNSYLISAKDLKVENEYVVSGYKVEEWIDDINTKSEILNRQDEEKALKTMEVKLVKL